MGCDQWVLEKIAKEEADKLAAKSTPPVEVVKVEVKDEKVPEPKKTRGKR